MRIELSEDRMTALLSVASPAEIDRYATESGLSAFLRSRGIVFGVDLSSTAKVLRCAAEQGRGVENMVIAEGLPPAPSSAVSRDSTSSCSAVSP